MSIQRRFGGYDIQRFVDGVYGAPVEHLVHRDGEAALGAVLAGFDGKTVDMDVNCFALAGPDGPWLIDAGCGTAWGGDYGHARAAMIAAGIQPQDVTRVLLTHIHGDHALGLFEGDAPYFPNAEIWVPETDLAFFTSAEERNKLPPARQGAFDIAARLIDVYGDRVRPIPTGRVAEGIEAVALPGHTPGHTGYLLGEGAERLLLWGDVLHSVNFQSVDPAVGVIYDIDQRIARETRLMALNDAAENDWLVSGGHLAGFFRIIRENGAFRFLPE